MRSEDIQYVPQVDHLRAVASIWIVLYHGLFVFGPTFTLESMQSVHSAVTYNPLRALWTEGHTAVALFMVLSGFIFTLGTFRKQISYKNFIVNRVLRIYPLYLCLILLSLSGSKGKGTNFLEFITSLMPLADFKWTHGGELVAMGWAVSIEFQFYLIFPFLLLFLNRAPIKTTVSVIGAALIFRIIGVSLYASPEDLSYWHLTGRIDQFILGMFTAAVLLTYKSQYQRSLPIVLCIAVPLSVLVLWGYQSMGGFGVDAKWKLFWPTVEGLVWSLFILGYVGTRQLFPSRASNVICKIGEMNFSIYLLHRLVLDALVTRPYLLTHPTGNWQTDVLINTLLPAIPITLAISWVTYRVIELPFLRLRRRYVPSGGNAPTGRL